MLSLILPVEESSASSSPVIESTQRGSYPHYLLSPTLITSPSKVMTPLFIRKSAWVFPLDALHGIIFKIKSFIAHNDRFLIQGPSSCPSPIFFQDNVMDNSNNNIVYENIVTLNEKHLTHKKSMSPHDQMSSSGPPCQLSIQVFVRKSTDEALVEIQRLIGTSIWYGPFQQALRQYLHSTSLLPTELLDFVSSLQKKRFFTSTEECLYAENNTSC